MKRQPQNELEDKATGAVWVASGKGSTWRTLIAYFGDDPYNIHYRVLDRATNLLITGTPIQEVDRQRWESGDVR